MRWRKVRGLPLLSRGNNVEAPGTGFEEPARKAAKPPRPPRNIMEPLSDIIATLPPTWKWDALFTPPTPPALEREWRAWLAQAQAAEERATLAHWAQRRRS